MEVSMIRLTRILRLISVLILALTTMAIAEAEERNTDVQSVAQELRVEIKELHQALGEVTAKSKNTEEICFRLGTVYQTSRYELEEVAAKQSGMTTAAKELMGALIRDAKSLPSFCGDKEKIKQDPGYEQVPKGDVADLRRELKLMDERASQLVSLP
jgi:hypothetical protein